MPSMDIFNSDAFSARSLTAAIAKVDYLPSLLGDMNIFDAKPVSTVQVMIEEMDGVLGLIKTTERGAPLPQRTAERRKARGFKTVRLAKGDRLYAHEIQGVRAFGSETELMQVQAEVMRRMAGPAGLLRDLQLTWENHRLGAVQGVVLDADGSTLFDWFTEFGVSQDTEIDFDLDNASPAEGAVRKKCTQVVRQMRVASKGAWSPATRVIGLCGDNFFDDLTAHKEVRATYLNTQAAAALRDGLAYEQVNYGGITFINYQGTDDGSTVGIGTDKCKFFPTNAPGAFDVAYSPGETFDFVNTPGQQQYALIVPDKDRNAWVDIEVYSYPLFYPTRPKMLQRAKRT